MTFKPAMKMENIYLSSDHTNYKEFPSVVALTSLRLIPTLLTSERQERNTKHTSSIAAKLRQGSHIFFKQKPHESTTLNDLNRLKTLCLLCNAKSQDSPGKLLFP